MEEDGRGRLDSWKDIAAYLNRDVRTAMRWEKRGLPVHRVPGGSRQLVFAYKDEIDEWLKGKWPPTGVLDSETSKTPGSLAAPESPTAVLAAPDSAAAPAKTQTPTQSAAAIPGDAPTALTADIKPQQVQAAALPGASPSRSWRGWRSAKWVGLAVCIFLLFSYPRWHGAQPQTLGLVPLTHDSRAKAYWGPLLTDRTRLYFGERQGEGMVLASVSIEGGDVARVLLPSGFWPTGISQNGVEFIGDGTISGGTKSFVAVPIVGGSPRWLMQPPRRTSSEPWSADSSWTRDGRKIAFCDEHNLFEVRGDGSRMHRLATLNGLPSWPRWSPDGKLLRFSVLSQKGERTSLWEIRADGTHLHPLNFPGSRFTDTRCGNWTPDGKYFIFQAKQDGRYDIWAIRERASWLRRSGSELVRLTSGPLDYYSPIPSRDGREIFAFGVELHGELMRFDLKSHAFVDFLGGMSVAEMDFSKDGQWVAYVTYPDYTLWRARADGSDALQLTFPPLEAREPHWSPNNRQIAFQGIHPGTRYKIYLVSSAGGPIREAVPGSGEESVATWSPDGQSLVYDEPLYRHDPSQMFIRRLDLKTGKTYKIPGSGGMWTARLSPDGRYIATLDATAFADPHHLFIIDTTTGRRKLMAIMPEIISEPTWSRDGKYVYFGTIGSSRPALYRVRVRDKKLEKLISLDGFPVAGLWTGVAPDGSPLLLRDISTEELYALHLRLP